MRYFNHGTLFTSPAVLAWQKNEQLHKCPGLFYNKSTARLFSIRKSRTARRQAMIIDVKEEKKRAEIWITRKEAAAGQTELKRLISQYRKQDYLVTVFYSGERSLPEMTGLLLKGYI